MKNIFALIFVVVFLSSCVSNNTDSVQLYRDDGLPMWVGNVFSDPTGFWAGYNDKKGFYAWGEAKYGDRNISTNAAELDAKKRLLSYLSNKYKLASNKASLVGVQRVDRFISDDGTVYVLLFISNKDARKSLAR